MAIAKFSVTVFLVVGAGGSRTVLAHGVHVFSVAKQTHGVHGLDSSAVCC